MGSELRRARADRQPAEMKGMNEMEMIATDGLMQEGQAAQARRGS